MFSNSYDGCFPYRLWQSSQAQIDAVNAAIEAAKTAEADVYLPDEFAAVQESMNSVMADIEAQKSKLFRKFGDVKLKLDEILTNANQLASDVAGKKEEVKGQVSAMMDGVKTVIEENKKLLPRLPRGKEGAQVIEQIKADFATVDAAVVEAQGLYDNGSFMDALNKINAAKEKAESLNAEIKEVLTKARIRF